MLSAVNMAALLDSMVHVIELFCSSVAVSNKIADRVCTEATFVFLGERRSQTTVTRW